MAHRLIYGERLMTSYEPERNTTMAPKLYTQHQYDTVCELLLRASHAYTKVYDRLQAAEVQLTTMRAKQRRAVEVFQRFDAPDTLSGVIEEQRRRGQRP